MAVASPEEVLEQLEEQCESTVQAFKRDLQKMRTGRASTSLLEGVDVDYYGSRTPLVHLGQISSPEPRLLVVQVYDASAVESVEKAIRSSDLGFNPSRDGNTLRIKVAALTEESRKEIVRHLHKLAEEIRISVRNHRREANDLLKKLEKDGDLAKDDSKRSQDKVQKSVDEYIAKIDQLLVAKEKEVMEV
ncbi:MAG: ribosome recycling factor [Bdellovibrionales bacterium]|nr:ribosome recycling factor [Bdellovibrionales bacterium]